MVRVHVPVIHDSVGTRDAGVGIGNGILPVKIDGIGSDMSQTQVLNRFRSGDGIQEQNSRSLLFNAVSEAVIPSMCEMMRFRHQLLDNALLDLQLGKNAGLDSEAVYSINEG